MTADRFTVTTDGPGAVGSELERSGGAAACADARRWTVAALPALGVRSSDMGDDAVLVVSEMVANAVEHGHPPVVLTLSYLADQLSVSVTDTGGPPYGFGTHAPDPTAVRGRGLAIVAALTAAWGITATRPGPGKTVWCILRDITPGP